METFLLDKEAKSILKIIAFIEKSPLHEVSFSDIQKNLGLSIKTTKTYLDTLLDYCEDNQLNTFTIENNYLKMAEKTGFNIFKIYHYLTQRSIKYHILTAIFNNTDITLVEIYKHFSISKSTASNYIKQMNQTFEPYQCQINFSKTKTIQGEEHQIRFLYHNLFYGLNLDEVIPNDPLLDSALQQLLLFVPGMTYAALCQTRIFFYTFQVRSKNNYLINNGDNFKIDDMPFISYNDFFNKLNDLDFFKYCPDLKTKQEESCYLYFLFCRVNLLTLNDIEDIHFQTMPTVSPDVNYMISQFQQRIKFELKRNELIFLHYNITLLDLEANIFKGKRKSFGADETIQKLMDNNSNTMAFIVQFIKDCHQNNQKINKSIQNFPSLYYDYAIIFKVLIKRNRRH